MFSLDAEITVDPEVCEDATESARETIDSGSWLQDLDLDELKIALYLYFPCCSDVDSVTFKINRLYLF